MARRRAPPPRHAPPRPAPAAHATADRLPSQRRRVAPLQAAAPPILPFRRRAKHLDVLTHRILLGAGNCGPPLERLSGPGATSSYERIRSAHTPAIMNRTHADWGVVFGNDLRIGNCCSTTTDSATTQRGPPGPVQRPNAHESSVRHARVAIAVRFGCARRYNTDLVVSACPKPQPGLAATPARSF